MHDNVHVNILLHPLVICELNAVLSTDGKYSTTDFTFPIDRMHTNLREKSHDNKDLYGCYYLRFVIGNGLHKNLKIL